MENYAMSFRPTSPTRPLTPDTSSGKPSFRSGMWQKLSHLWGRDEANRIFERDMRSSSLDATTPIPPKLAEEGRSVGVGLPRQTTFTRQKSEERDRLCTVPRGVDERRTFSVSRQRSISADPWRSKSSPPTKTPLPADNDSNHVTLSQHPPLGPPNDDPSLLSTIQEGPLGGGISPPSRQPSITPSTGSYERNRYQLDERAQLNIELDTEWILNLSMHFKDKSDREKFFVTYAEAPNKWRRLTVSCDYRNAEPGSLEMDLKELTYQRDKNLQIYESIRESLTEIQFYDTVTNLKLETTDGRLHVHVTEDVNEIIPYPPTSSISHILHGEDYRPLQVCEDDLSFDAHLSGFVYRVRHKGKIYIKKEIPGPDTVDEFLYEINALHALQHSDNVIALEGIVLDNSRQVIKGLLISYAERGAVVDLLYDHKGAIPWADRERWARHAIQGLSEIHEEGYVQGDFTLSNIVVDHDNDAKIIDINRRGCPIGWEPPELAKKIASNQRISMYIGQKSDLYQLGMTLWALAMDDDEPERHDPPLMTKEFPREVPFWYQDIVRICLSNRPRDRLSAKELLAMCSSTSHDSAWPPRIDRPTVRHHSEIHYIHPDDAVGHDDLERFREQNHASDDIMYSPESSREDYTYTYPHSSVYRHDYSSEASELERPRGRRRISDHDQLLQAQRRSQPVSINGGNQVRTTSQIPEIYTIEPDDPFQYEVDSDGLPRYLSETIDLAHQRALRQHANLQARTTSVSPPRISGTIHLSEADIAPQVAHGSEISQTTPRNSKIQISTDVSPVETSEVSQDAMATPAELMCLGSHPNVSLESLNEKDTANPEEVLIEPAVNSIPRQLPFQDSGYCEPKVFGLENDVNEGVEKTESAPGQPHPDTVEKTISTESAERQPISDITSENISELHQNEEVGQTVKKEERTTQGVDGAQTSSPWTACELPP